MDFSPLQTTASSCLQTRSPREFRKTPNANKHQRSNRFMKGETRPSPLTSPAPGITKVWREIQGRLIKMNRGITAPEQTVLASAGKDAEKCYGAGNALMNGLRSVNDFTDFSLREMKLGISYFPAAGVIPAHGMVFIYKFWPLKFGTTVPTHPSSLCILPVLGVSRAERNELSISHIFT